MVKKSTVTRVSGCLMTVTPGERLVVTSSHRPQCKPTVDSGVDSGVDAGTRGRGSCGSSHHA